jgi:hypothetical protein
MAQLMRTKPFALVDWSYWRSLELIPVTVLADEDPSTPDGYQPGFLFAGQSRAYTLVLEPGMAYRFDVNFEGTAAGKAYLSVGDTGQLLWANAPGLAALGLDPARADRPVMVDAPTEVTLALHNADEQVHTPFDAYVSVEPQPVYDAENVYRFVKLSTGQYFYTASEAEREIIATEYPDFRFEGPVFAGDETPRHDYIPVHRFADLVTGGYFYTASEEERQFVETTMADRMRYENIAFYVPEEEEPGVTQPVIRLKNLDTGGYLFTANPEEVLFAQLQLDSPWEYQGVAFHALPVVSAAPELPPADVVPEADPLALIGTADLLPDLPLA